MSVMITQVFAKFTTPEHCYESSPIRSFALFSIPFKLKSDRQFRRAPHNCPSPHIQINSNRNYSNVGLPRKPRAASMSFVITSSALRFLQILVHYECMLSLYIWIWTDARAYVVRTTTITSRAYLVYFVIL